MLCPNCDLELKMSERQGIEIDYCPRCRGVWLDRGELDKIIERTNKRMDSSPKRGQYQNHPKDYHKNKNDYYEREYHKNKKKKKRKSMLDDIFDFDLF